MHESELICPLMNIVRKAPAVTPPEKGTAEKSTAEDKTSSGGLRLGELKHFENEKKIYVQSEIPLRLRFSRGRGCVSLRCLWSRHQKSGET